MTREGRAPLLTRAFVLLGVADLAYFTSVGVAVLLLPRWSTGPVGSDEAGAGLAFGAFAITALVCRPYAGRLADRHGRRWLMIFGAALCAVGMAALPFATSLAAVVAIRLVQGVAEAAFFVGGFALLADLAPAERLGEAISYNSLGLYLGFALGPPWASGSSSAPASWSPGWSPPGWGRLPSCSWRSWSSLPGTWPTAAGTAGSSTGPRSRCRWPSSPRSAR